MTNVVKIGKRILITILIVNIIFAIVNTSHALSLSSIQESGDEFLGLGKEQAEGTQNIANIKGIINGIFSLIFPLGVAITVIVGGVLGIKFMLASAEDKAKLKEVLIPYTVGCILIFGATGIWNVVVNLSGEIVTGYNENGYGSSQEASKATMEIAEGTLDLSKVSNEQIKDLYRHNIIAQDIRGNVGRPGYDSSLTDQQRVEKFISSRGEKDTKVKIYKEAKRRGLLKGNGIDLK